MASRPRRQTDMLDHDLLVTINVQLKNLTDQFNTFRTDQEKEVRNIQTVQAVTNENFGARLRKVEDKIVWVSGFSAAIGAVVSFLANRFF